MQYSSSLEGEFFIDNLLVRICFATKMIQRTGLAPWDFEFPFPPWGSLQASLPGCWCWRSSAGWLCGGRATALLPSQSQSPPPPGGERPSPSSPTPRTERSPSPLAPPSWPAPTSIASRRPRSAEGEAMVCYEANPRYGYLVGPYSRQARRDKGRYPHPAFVPERSIIRDAWCSAVGTANI